MAICKFGGGITGIRGTLGGNTFSANTNGAFVRQWSRVHNPQTISQAVNRYYWSYIPSLWRALTSGQRTDWNDYGAANALTNKLGETYYRTGYQWFAHCAQNLYVIGGTPPTDAPVDPAPAAVTPTSVYYDDDGALGRCSVNFNEGDFDGYWLVCMFRPIIAYAPMSAPSGYSLLAGNFEPAGTTVNYIVYHNIKWGSPQLGWTGFWHVFTGDTQGLRSAAWATTLDFSET